MNYSIGIVTYHARFEKYFCPLVKKLAEVFPDKQIICIANGHPDKEIQNPYLEKFTTFCKSISNVKYFTHSDNQSLTKCWNQLIASADTEGLLILNDDTQVTELFRDEFEAKIIRKSLWFTSINGSWSHFFITKGIIKQVGWFDENFPGIGQEDADYMFRLTVSNIPVTDTRCLGIKNYVAPAENPTWKNISDVADKKYSSANKDYLKSKYLTKDFDPETKEFKYYLSWKGGLSGFTPKVSNLTPTTYPAEFLKYKESDLSINYKKKFTIKKLAQRIKYSFLSLAKQAYYMLISIYKK